mgnify:CR=1 FL=1
MRFGVLLFLDFLVLVHRLAHEDWFLLLGGWRLLLVAAIKAIFDETFLLFWFTHLFLFFDKEGKPIFKWVFRPSFEKVDDFWPLLAMTATNLGQEENVFLNFPRTFFKVRIQEAIPVLSALFRASKDLVL